MLATGKNGSSPLIPTRSRCRRRRQSHRTARNLRGRACLMPPMRWCRTIRHRISSLLLVHVRHNRCLKFVRCRRLRLTARNLRGRACLMPPMRWCRTIRHRISSLLLVHVRHNRCLKFVRCRRLRLTARNLRGRACLMPPMHWCRTIRQPDRQPGKKLSDPSQRSSRRHSGSECVSSGVRLHHHCITMAPVRLLRWRRVSAP